MDQFCYKIILQILLFVAYYNSTNPEMAATKKVSKQWNHHGSNDWHISSHLAELKINLEVLNLQ